MNWQHIRYLDSKDNVSLYQANEYVNNQHSIQYWGNKASTSLIQIRKYSIKESECRTTIRVDCGSKQLNQPNQRDDSTDDAANKFKIRYDWVLWHDVKMNVELLVIRFQSVDFCSIIVDKVLYLALLSSSREEIHLCWFVLKLLILNFKFLPFFNQLITSVLQLFLQL